MLKVLKARGGPIAVVASTSLFALVEHIEVFSLVPYPSWLLVESGVITGEYLWRVPASSMLGYILVTCVFSIIIWRAKSDRERMCAIAVYASISVISGCQMFALARWLTWLADSLAPPSG